MTDEEAYKLFDSILRKSILESLEALEEKRKNHTAIPEGEMHPTLWRRHLILWLQTSKQSGLLSI